MNMVGMMCIYFIMTERQAQLPRARVEVGMLLWDMPERS
jgi:hypothetical protein